MRISVLDEFLDHFKVAGVLLEPFAKSKAFLSNLVETFLGFLLLLLCVNMFDFVHREFVVEPLESSLSILIRYRCLFPHVVF